MSRREDIDNAIWSDPDFEPLSPAAKLIYIWSFTNPRCGMAGIYKTSVRACGLETGVGEDRARQVFEELDKAGFIVYQDHVLWVRTRVKHLRSRSPQIAKSIARDVEKLDEAHPLRQRFLVEYATTLWLKAELTDLALQARSSEPINTPSGTSLRFQGKGKGKGRGKGYGVGVQGEGRNWTAYAAMHMPDFPADVVAITAGRLAGGGIKFTPEELRAAVLQSNPTLNTPLKEAA